MALRSKPPTSAGFLRSIRVNYQLSPERREPWRKASNGAREPCRSTAMMALTQRPPASSTDPSHQIREDYFGAGGVWVIAVTDLVSAKAAFTLDDRRIRRSRVS